MDSNKLIELLEQPKSIGKFTILHHRLFGLYKSCYLVYKGAAMLFGIGSENVVPNMGINWCLSRELEDRGNHSGL